MNQKGANRRRAKKAKKPRVSVRKLKTAVKQDPRNANLGTDRGRAMIGSSVRTHGAGRSLLLDKNGVAIAGNKSAESMLAEGITEVIVVETDGSQAVAVQRIDLELDGEDGKARALAYGDNRTAEVDLDWDIDALLSAIDAEDSHVSELWNDREIDYLREMNMIKDGEDFNESLADGLIAKPRFTLTCETGSVDAVRILLEKMVSDIPGTVFREGYQV